MKKIVLMLMLLLGGFFVASAQKMLTADELAKKNVDELEKRLKLTPTQRSVIYNFAYDVAKEQLSLVKKQQTGTFKEEDETKFFKIQADLNKNIKTVLKGDQIPEFDKLVEERLSGIDPKKKKKKLKKGEEEEKVVGIEGLRSNVN